MRKYILPALLAALTLTVSGVASADEGWIEPFNGKDLTGWTQKNGTASYVVEEGGIIRGKTNEGSPNSFLCTDKDYGDFELEFDVKCDDGLNSGVQIRSQTAAAKGNEKFGRVNGPQVEIEKSTGEAGYVYGEATGRGWLTPESRLKPHDHFKNGEWNHYRVIAKGPRIETFINGEPIEDLTDEAIYKTHPTGFIGLQVHGIGKGQGPYEVRWKNIKIKPL